MIKQGWKYQVKYVNHRSFGDKQITEFKISDKVYHGDTQKWQSFPVTIWENIDLKDGDNIEFEEIQVNTSEYKEKIIIGLSGKVKVHKTNVVADTTPKDDYKPPFDI